MPKKNKTLEIIAGIISFEVGVSKDKVTPEARLVEDLDADSFDRVELVIGLEEEFNVTIPDEDAAKMKTVKDIVNFIEGAAKG